MALPRLQAGNHAALRPKRDGAPGRIRTHDPQIRSLVLYPVELRAHGRRQSGRDPSDSGAC